MNRILLQGVGGVGGWLAAELIRSGHDITLVTGNASITEAINRNGIALTTPERNFHVAAQAHTALEDLPPAQRFDCVFLAMMAGSVVAAAEAARAVLREDGCFVSFQNGFVEDAIGEAVGIERVISATVALGSSMEAPGVYRRTTPGRLIIGEMDGSVSPRLEALRSILAHVVDTEISTNIVGVLWGKLIWNGAVSGLCAISGKQLGELFDCTIGRELFLRAFYESVSTARAQGVTIETVIVNPDDYYCDPADAPERRTELLERTLAFVDKYVGVTPSTLESLKRGRRSEIDFLNGYIRRCAQAAGRAVPLNDHLIEMVHEIEAGQRQLSAANLDELAARLP
ncbi:MAG: ketopantoate reductase family protein [Gammaproteobacteria bacterium]|jgi:2-dehydropantoate 2-reductase